MTIGEPNTSGYRDLCNCSFISQITKKRDCEQSDDSKYNRCEALEVLGVAICFFFLLVFVLRRNLERT
jgi:hypothetical protein